MSRSTMGRFKKAIIKLLYIIFPVCVFGIVYFFFIAPEDFILQISADFNYKSPAKNIKITVGADVSSTDSLGKTQIVIKGRPGDSLTIMAVDPQFNQVLKIDTTIPKNVSKKTFSINFTFPLPGRIIRFITPQDSGFAVMVDGVMLGSTRSPDNALTKKLTGGVHNIRIFDQQRKGYYDHDSSFTVEPSKAIGEYFAVLTPLPQKPSIYVTSQPPGAIVRYDGVAQPGRTPLIITDVSINTEHVIETEFQGETKEERIILSQNETSRRITQNFPWCIVTIRTSPPKADIFIDGEKEPQQSPMTKLLRYGQYVIKAMYQKNETVDTEITVNREMVEVMLQLPVAAPRGVLALTTEPTGANISVDGSNVGTTTENGLIVPNIEYGQHVVSAALGTRTVNTSVDLDVPRLPLHLVLPPELPRGSVEIHSVPSGAEVWINDRLQGVTPWVGELQYGTYNVNVRAAGSERTCSYSIDVNGKYLYKQCYLLNCESYIQEATRIYQAIGADSGETVQWKQIITLLGGCADEMLSVEQRKRVLYLRGYANYRLELYDAAQKNFTDRNAYGEFAYAYYYLGKLYEDYRHDFTQAIQAYREVIRNVSQVNINDRERIEGDAWYGIGTCNVQLMILENAKPNPDVTLVNNYMRQANGALEQYLNGFCNGGETDRSTHCEDAEDILNQLR